MSDERKPDDEAAPLHVRRHGRLGLYDRNGARFTFSDGWEHDSLNTYRWRRAFDAAYEAEHPN